MPVSVVEAQASGLKCLLSDVITKDVELTDLLMYYSLNEDAKHWAKALSDMIPQMRLPISEQNFNRLASFDCKNTIKELEKFYSECVHGV